MRGIVVRTRILHDEHMCTGRASAVIASADLSLSRAFMLCVFVYVFVMYVVRAMCTESEIQSVHMYKNQHGIICVLRVMYMNSRNIKKQQNAQFAISKNPPQNPLLMSAHQTLTQMMFEHNDVSAQWDRRRSTTHEIHNTHVLFH